ncbi:MAG: hypothetical protein AB7P22_14620 [Vicinamibacterales bacterium]
MSLSLAEILNGNPILDLTLYGLYSDGSLQDVTNACIAINCLTSPSELLDIDGMGVAEIVLLLIQGLLEPNHQINATYGGFTANANVAITDIPVVGSLQILGSDGASANLGSQLPAVLAFLTGSQGLSAELDADFPGLTYDLNPGTPVCSIPVLGGVLCPVIVPLLNTLGDTLEIVDGELVGDTSILDDILDLVEGLVGATIYLPIDATATINGVAGVNDTIQLRLQP